ncbi:MAG: GHMP kinase [Terriglobia bacterium]|jgi:D-glycero-alpha-D-manno-heptose-7-phosphate kinase
MLIESIAPTRVDLAGGTVDIWPLYLFHENACTVNFAIDQFARCKIRTRRDRKIVLKSIDGKKTARFNSLEELKGDRVLPLLSRLIWEFAPNPGFEMTTHCMAPAGSGLGGSSALNIAICGALKALTKSPLSKPAIQSLAKNVEAQVINIPTGEQDYYPPLYGGALCMHLTARGTRVERIPIDLQKLENHLVLCFTGEPRYSAINNWEMFKRHVNGDRSTFAKFETIVQSAVRMREALLAADFEALSVALAEEWRHRKHLAPRITTPFMEKLTHIARHKGATAAKVCGAGGGGCMVFATPQECKRKVQRALRAAGGRVIDFRIVSQGLKVKVS